MAEEEHINEYEKEQNEIDDAKYFNSKYNWKKKIPKAESISIRLDQELRAKIPRYNYTDFLQNVIEKYFIYKDQLEFLWNLFQNKGKNIKQAFKTMPSPKEIIILKEIKHQVEKIERNRLKEKEERENV